MDFDADVNGSMEEVTTATTTTKSTTSDGFFSPKKVGYEFRTIVDVDVDVDDDVVDDRRHETFLPMGLKYF